MLTASATLQNALNNGYVLKAQPRLIAEWNQNRYATVLEVDNTPAESTIDADLSSFPIGTIALPNRPSAGIVKARAVSSVGGGEGKTSYDYSDRVDAVRYYVSSPKSLYKYWSSTAKTASTGTSPLTITTQQPRVVYTTSVWSNKIVIGLENSYSSPVAWTIDITTNGTTWTTISTNPAVPTNGQVVIYRQANGTWGTTVYRDAPTQIRGVRITVTSMNKTNAHLNVIEISPRLESDLSQYLVTPEAEFSMSETNFVTPIGRASSNSGSVTLFNPDGLFSNDNVDSMYYGLIAKNIKMTLDMGYDLTDFGSATVEYIRMFTMHTDNWNIGTETVSTELKDSSKFLQEQKAPDLFLRSLTIGESVWRVCDCIGFNNYFYDTNDMASSTQVDYFWCTKEDTVWDVFSKLAEGTQTAIFFDQYDVLQIQTRDTAFDTSRAVDWALQATNTGGKLADIVSLEETYNFEANKVNITYKETSLLTDSDGNPATETIWQPEGDFVLRSSSLAGAMTTSSMTFKITPAEAEKWPFEGIVQIEGELIKYKGKTYAYKEKTTGLTKTIIISSKDEKENVDKNLSEPSLAYTNKFTGEFTVVQRGYLWTSPMAHSTALVGTYYSRKARLGSVVNTKSFYTHDVANSILKLSTNSTFDLSTLYVVSHGDVAGGGWANYGVRFRQPAAGQGNGGGGLAFHLGALDVGYYVELTRTAVLEANNGARRAVQNELALFVKKSDGSMKRLAPGGKGSAHTIATDVWYDLDITFRIDAATANHIISIYLNGVRVQTLTIIGGDRAAVTPRHGVFTRGYNTSEFEYVYATMNGNWHDDVDDVSSYDRIRQGFVGSQWDRKYLYSMWFTKRGIDDRYNQVQKDLYKNYLFDDFGPFVHEYRELDIPFSKFPVVSSNVYFTNDSQAYCPEFNGSSFGAKFVLVNASREDAVLEGPDKLTQPGVELSQHLMMFGQTVTQKDEAVHTVTNDNGIRRSGIVEVDIDNEWIQSKAAAVKLGEWIIAHWAGGSDQIQVDIFGNPLISVGDLVSINYPDKDMAPTTHKYFVVSVSHSWDNGLSTQLTLRRARI